MRLMLHTVARQSVGIYEPIYINGQTINQASFLPYFHVSNKYYSRWREFRIHIEMYRSRFYERHLFTGLFSPKFELKTRIKGKDFIEFCMCNPDADVVLINPFPHLAYMSFNVWSHAEACHTGIVKIAQQLLSDASIKLVLDIDARHDSSVLSYSSFWCGTRSFWHSFVGEILNPLAIFLEANPNAPSVQNAMQETLHADPAPFLPFITERLFTTYISQKPDLTIASYPLNPYDYCLHEMELNRLKCIKDEVDIADKYQMYPPHLKVSIQDFLLQTFIPYHLDYNKNNPHPHYGRIIA